ATWFQVCEEFCEGFAAKLYQEKNDIGNLCFVAGSKFMKRRKGIKDSFIKCERKRTKSGQGAISSRRYIYARQLSVPANTVDPGPTQTHVDDNGLAGSETADELTAETSSPAKSEPAVKRRRIIEDSLLKFKNTPVPSTSPEAPDNEKLFLESLVPAVKTFPLDVKLELRCEVMKHE
ncbi:uncharacterized protein LOC126184068, partial [Schistocerca cancellata]|uniref:uncharacterized protein LOC126184068 n=1 Tax=Schistocerca cancellata TaxID=274614 RepID=UPI002118ACB6